MSCCNSAAFCIDKRPRIKKPSPKSVLPYKWLKLKRGITRYVDMGNKRAKHAVILMPDPPNTIEHMQELISIVDKNYRVIAFEPLGFGYSTAGMQHDFSLQHCADVIAEVLEKLEASNSILAFTCLAALPGLMVAQKYPELVSGIVFGQTPSLEEGKAWAKGVGFNGILGTPFLGQLSVLLGKSKVSEVWYKNAFPKGTDTKSCLEITLKSYKEGARFSLASSFQATQQANETSTDLTANQNAIVLWGNLDRTHRKTNKHDILNLLPNGSLIELDNCGHFPDLEVPDQFADAIQAIAVQS